MTAGRAVLLVWAVWAVFLSPGMCPGASVIWLEAEQFDDPGGWTNDAQFVDQMGSPYLLAIGLDGPVEDAATRARVPAAGTYRLWVRSRDWVPEYSPGRFQVLLDGKPVEHVFGQGKAQGWSWEDGGVHQLDGGEIEVGLRDLTGHYGRCDAVVLTDDLTYRPPADLDRLAAARQQYGGVSREAERLEPYDTVVVGGGLAGCFAAVASARNGCRTALIQNRPVLGGNTSTEILVAPQGDKSREPLDPGEGGIIEEVRGDVENYSDRLLAICRAEENLDLFLNTHAVGVEMNNDGTVAAVETLNVNSNRRLVFPAKVFIDCTGDGAIGVWAGAEYRHGREPASMYGESRAPEEGDARTMGGTLRYASQLQPEPVKFEAPAWARRFPNCSDFNERRHPQLHFGGWQWVIEYGGMMNTYDDAEPIRDELLRIVWGMWDHVKNHCPKLSEEAKPYKLVWVSHVVGKRESRRLIGDYIMTEHDIVDRVLQPDRVSYGGWGIDLHPPGGFYDEEPPAITTHRQKFSVPFRSLYSKDVANLMMAGRCLSASHVALGATRVMITCGLQGQAVGTAAGICKRHDCTPHDVYPSYVAELQQQLLKDGCYIVKLPNSDPADLALGAEVSASSTSPPVNIASRDKSFIHALTCDRAVMFKTTQPKIDTVSLYLGSEKDSPLEVVLGLRRAAELGDFSSEENLATATATVPPKSEGWIDFHLGAKVEPGYYYAWIPQTPGLSWWLFAVAPPETARAYRSRDAWKVMDQCYKHKVSPSDEKQEPQPLAEDMFRPANVVNGFARAVEGWPNSWRPDPDEPLPQWVELDFGRQQSFNCVHVSFQAQWMRAEAFRVEVYRDGRWETIAEITDNLNRRRVVRFERTTASKLRLVLTKTTPDAGVCEIRVYDEPRQEP